MSRDRSDQITRVNSTRRHESSLSAVYLEMASYRLRSKACPVLEVGPSLAVCGVALLISYLRDHGGGVCVHCPEEHLCFIGLRSKGRLLK
jgi:hypothetical protein